MSKSSPLNRDAHQDEIVKLLRASSVRHPLHEVFRDFCELAALSFSNAIDRMKYDAREARYLAILSRYAKPEIERFPQMLAYLTMSLESGMKDTLGSLFGTLELSNHWNGQYFTPYPIARMMANMNLVDVDEKWIQDRGGLLTLNEPAVGSGVMVIAVAQALYERKINYQQCLHVTACDIDPTVLHMAYVQLSLLHVPALLIHGNSLSGETWDHWVTPAHVMGFWDARLRRRAENGVASTGSLLLPTSALEECGTETAESRDAALQSQRERIIAERIEAAEQLSLF